MAELRSSVCLFEINYVILERRKIGVEQSFHPWYLKCSCIYIYIYIGALSWKIFRITTRIKNVQWRKLANTSIPISISSASNKTLVTWKGRVGRATVTRFPRANKVLKHLKPASKSYGEIEMLPACVREIRVRTSLHSAGYEFTECEKGEGKEEERKKG